MKDYKGEEPKELEKIDEEFLKNLDNTIYEITKDFNEYNYSKNIKPMLKIINKALAESLHKRIAYLKGLKIITLPEYAKLNKLSGSVTSSLKCVSVTCTISTGPSSSGCS